MVRLYVFKVNIDELYCFANIARLFIIIIPFFSSITDAAARSFVWVTT